MRPPPFTAALFHPGQRVAAAVSGGADSVALLRLLIEERRKLGLALAVVHVHHGIRGPAADADAEFVQSLARAFELPFHLRHVDAPAASQARGETLEEAARNLRYACFGELLAAGAADSVATAHTLDDQAETVLHKFMRGAWTEGLSGIHAVLPLPPGSVLRPLLEASRAEIESWLGALGQPWREDASNADLAHTRNRIRHRLLPLLKEFNPGIARQLARLATVAGEEERYWQAELDRLLPTLLLPGRPVRGGGRSISTAWGAAGSGGSQLSIDLDRLCGLPHALRRRVLRAAARQLGARLGFDHTESLMTFASAPERRVGKKADLPAGLAAERTHRELRLSRSSAGPPPAAEREYSFQIPGEVVAPEFGLLLRAQRSGLEGGDSTIGGSATGGSAILRRWRPGDRVKPLHSAGSKKVAEILDRLGVSGADRRRWPVVEAGNRIVWMRGIEIESPGLKFTASFLS